MKRSMKLALLIGALMLGTSLAGSVARAGDSCSYDGSWVCCDSDVFDYDTGTFQNCFPAI
jgi:hypothetical protein